MSDTLCKKIIFDCDVGTDDAWALLMLLRAEKEFNIKVIAITCTHGNTTLDNVAINVLRVLETVDRLDIPIYKGASDSLLPKPVDKNPFHGIDGLGDICNKTLPSDMSLIQEKHAVTAIYDLVINNPNLITIISVGPLTNLALAYKMYPEIVSQIKDIFIMGGNHLGVGNMTRAAEFNFHADPESAHIVLDGSKCMVTILPWEACLEKNFLISMDWRINVLGKIDNKITKLLNPAEENCYIPRNYQSWNPCDCLLIAAFLNPSKIIKKVSRCHATIELGGFHTRGQVVIDHLGKEEENTVFIEIIDAEEFKKMILWTADNKIDFNK